MRALPTELRKQLEDAVLAGRNAAEAGVRAAFASLGVQETSKPGHLGEEQARLRRALRAKQRQLGGDFDVLVWDAAYEQWHRLLFARFLAENNLLRHPEYDAPVTLAECDELADELDEPDGWSVAARFAAEILPGIFRRDDPCVRLRLAPEHRAALERVVADLAVEIFAADDSLGWVYQYWQSERKDQVNASEVKIGGADLGPVTQLFTENYMVRFLLENSLGAWWATRHPDSPLIKEFDYLRFDEDAQPAAGTFDGWPDTVAEVTVMDPCCGSGHFLIEAFGMLWRMRVEEEGLDPVGAQNAVLRDNLFGLELDPRCLQIAMFAIALTAWKQGGGYRKLPTPNIACSGIPAKASMEEWTALADDNERLKTTLERLHILFKNADTLGSLIDPRRAAEMANASGRQKMMWDVDFDEVAPLLEKAAARETNDPATAVLGADAAGIARAASLLSRTYTLIATNVPFLHRQKQEDVLAESLERLYPAGKADLATAFLVRILRWAEPGGASATVSPGTWLFLGPYRELRKTLLERGQLPLIARLGPGAFAEISGEVVKPVLSINLQSNTDERMALLSVDQASGPSEYSALIQSTDFIWSQPDVQLSNPDEIIVFVEIKEDLNRLDEFATSYLGVCTGDNQRFARVFWELRTIEQPWARIVGTVRESVAWGGRKEVLNWNDGHGELLAFIRERLGRGREGAWIRGQDAWGRNGVVLSRAGDFPGTLYEGELFLDSAAVIVPDDPNDVAAVWAFTQSEEYRTRLRELNRKVLVTVSTMTKVPFDVERWREVALEEFPEGLPEPRSNDPTQWLFKGRPEVSTEPLQVGVGRLVGYRWPEQSGSDRLEAHADDHGIVCLPAVGGDQPAADRLTALLADACGEDWSPALVRQLLEEAGSKKKTLVDWLRGDFFKHHCAVFSNRPFVWHITDGRKDGFSALVNYHRLDRAGLEKLTYTYLGDWIERQCADAAEDVAGADLRLAAAKELKSKLKAILEGEPPYDIYIRWKELHEQPIGWEPDLDDGVRLNIRPFVKAEVLAGPASVPRVHWKKDRGRNPDGSERRNDIHLSIAEKQEARRKAGTE